MKLKLLLKEGSHPNRLCILKSHENSSIWLKFQ